MRRIRSPCCARAASGHAQRRPSRVMNSRRFIQSPRKRAIDPLVDNAALPCACARPAASLRGWCVARIARACSARDTNQRRFFRARVCLPKASALPIRPERRMLIRKAVPTPDQVRGRLFRDHAPAETSEHRRFWATLGRANLLHRRGNLQCCRPAWKGQSELCGNGKCDHASESSSMFRFQRNGTCSNLAIALLRDARLNGPGDTQHAHP